VDEDDTEANAASRGEEQATQLRGRQPEPEPEPEPRPQRRPWMGPTVLVAGVVAGVLAVCLVAAVLVVRSWHPLGDWRHPFASRSVDRSGPVLLASVRDLSRYDAASGSFQVIIDLEQDARFLPAAIRGERTLFVGAGTVDAYVDFGGLGPRSVSVSADRTAVTLRLPHALLGPAAMDTRRSYVVAAQRGLLDRIGAFFSAEPNSQQRLYVLAQQKIQQAAGQAGLVARGETNTRTMLTGMMHSLGFRAVAVTFG
jgi:hypothetical protein